MRLEGSLDAFGLGDVLTLLGTTRKSGALRLRRANPTGPCGVVWFRDGRIAAAMSDTSRAELLRRLVGAGAVDDAALHAALSRARPGAVGIVRALLETGAIDAEYVREVAVDQIIDGLLELLQWTDGEFSLDADAIDVDDLGIALDHTVAFADAVARLATSLEITAHIPSGDCVLVLPVVPNQVPDLSREEWGLLSLVDGRRSARDIAELTGRGEFAVSKSLAHLVQSGLLAVKDDSTPHHVTVLERRLGLISDYESAIDPPIPAVDRDAHIPSARPARVMPEGPGAHGMTAAAALAAARAAQREAAAQASPVGAFDARPAARAAALSSFPDSSPSSGSAAVAERADFAAAAHSPSLAVREHAGSRGPDSLTRTPGGYDRSGFAVDPTVVAAGGIAATSTARALVNPAERPDGVIERDPGVNRSLLLRLIAGVRGL